MKSKSYVKKILLLFLLIIIIASLSKLKKESLGNFSLIEDTNTITNPDFLNSASIKQEEKISSNNEGKYPANDASIPMENQTDSNLMLQIIIEIIKGITALFGLLAAFFGLKAAVYKISNLKKKQIERERLVSLEWYQKLLKPIHFIAKPLRYIKRIKNIENICLEDKLYLIFFDYLNKIKNSKRKRNVLKWINNFKDLLQDESFRDFPTYFIEKGIDIIAEKCNNPDIKVSSIAFNCLSYLYMLNPALKMKVLLDVVEDLLNEAETDFVINQAAIHLYTFLKFLKLTSIEEKEKYLYLINKRYEELMKKDELSEFDISEMISYIKGIEFSEDYSDILNTTFSNATILAEKLLKTKRKDITALEKYVCALCSLDDAKAIDREKVRKAIHTYEKWLKSDYCSREDKEYQIVTLFKLFNHRKVRKKRRERLSIIERQILVYHGKNREMHLEGKVKDISETGVGFELLCYLEEVYINQDNDNIFTILYFEEKYDLSVVDLIIFKNNHDPEPLKIQGTLKWASRNESSDEAKSDFGVQFATPISKEQIQRLL